MFLIRCDFCGKTARSKNYTFNRLRFIDNVVDERGEETIFDLCEDCSKKVKKFIKESITKEVYANLDAEKSKINSKRKI